MPKEQEQPMEQREQTGTRSRSAESRQRKTEGQQTMEEYLLSQLDTPVVLKDGTMMTKPDGSPMTKQEAIATNILNLAMNRRSSESRAKRLAA